MEFINNGNPVKIRIGGIRDCHWATIRKGESVELTARAGLSYGFSVKTTKGQIGIKKVETKQIEVSKVSKVNESKDFLKELIKIKGIGKKTAKDITKIFPEREELIKKIRLTANTNALPIRDDISKILEEYYDIK